ncbi:MAG: hypothetical protein NTW10_02405 [Bacteroidetes bacterium]|nr:hypothetical protein [Bacteroidota bacterium]
MKTVNSLMDEYIQYFGNEPPFPPKHIMETLVKMKKEGRFEGVIKSLEPYKDELRNEIENISGEEMGLSNPFFKIDFNKEK